MKLKQQPEDFIVKEISTVEPKEEGNYTYFVLKKRNTGTIEAMQMIAKGLRVPLKWINCAGNKDKIAMTEQVCSVASIAPETLLGIRIQHVELTPIGKGDKPVNVGDLKGNKFKITVRDIQELPPRKTRFVNLFGEQRFSTNNAEIGKAITKRDFKQAVSLVLQTKSIAARKIHEHIARSPKDYLGALKTIPLKLLKLYVHAYQSLLWNISAKEYAKKHSENTKLPIIGFGTDVTEELREVLKKEGITARDFVIKEFPDLSSEGTERNVFSEANEVVIGKLEEDELNKERKKAKIEFTLPPGSYATEYVKQLFDI